MRILLRCAGRGFWSRRGGDRIGKFLISWCLTEPFVCSTGCTGLGVSSA